MKFVWYMDEKKWEEFANALDRGAFDVAKMEGEFLGYCRVGELCFDIRAWSPGKDEWCGWGFELYVGGVDTGYGYSAPQISPEWKSKYDVPNELWYPYDEVDYGEFPAGFETYKLSVFEREAEKVFEQFIKNTAMVYDKANLISKANEPLHVW